MPINRFSARDVLSTAFPSDVDDWDGLRDLGPPDFDVRELIPGQTPVIRWGPRVDDDFVPPSEAEIEAGTLLGRSVHDLAWYIPYSKMPNHWGIFFHAVNFPDAVASLWARISVTNQAPPNYAAVEQALYRIILEHEMFHARVEVTGAHWHLASQAPISAYRAKFSDSALRDKQEILATAIEMTATRRPQSVDRQLWSQVLKVWQQTPAPHPYSRWQDGVNDWDSLAGELATALGGGHDTQLFRAISAPTLRPRWWIPPGLPTGGLSGLLRGAAGTFSFQDVNKRLHRRALQKEFGYWAVSDEQGTAASGGRHPKAHQFARERPTFKCPVKPSAQPFRHWDQLARLFGLALDDESSRDPMMKRQARKILVCRG